MSAVQEFFLAHLSDLHVGAFCGSTGVTRNPFVRHHHLEIAKGLTRSLDVLARKAVARPGCTFKVLVSGDLTATGAEQEFANAQMFLGSNWLTCFGRPSTAGLSLSHQVAHTVPGNHDHWGGLTGVANAGGAWPRGYGLPSPAQFRITPWRETWTSPDGSLELDLFGADTSSGITGRNVRALGKLSQSESDKLEELLDDSGPGPGVAKRVRALMVHHSPSHAGLSNVLDPTSASRLVDLCQKHGVSAILCGDVHTFKTAALSGNPPLYELRSPTSMQGPAYRADAGFLLHRVSLMPGGGARWQAYLHRWASPGPAFALAASSRGQPDADFRCV
jgi:3',5'-cyclic AMP phosphodiesterase CpdA